jgi:hypothetical protein
MMFNIVVAIRRGGNSPPPAPLAIPATNIIIELESRDLRP